MLLLKVISERFIIVLGIINVYLIMVIIYMRMYEVILIYIMYIMNENIMNL